MSNEVPQWVKEAPADDQWAYLQAQSREKQARKEQQRMRNPFFRWLRTTRARRLTAITTILLPMFGIAALLLGSELIPVYLAFVLLGFLMQKFLQWSTADVTKDMRPGRARDPRVRQALVEARSRTYPFIFVALAVAGIAVTFPLDGFVRFLVVCAVAWVAATLPILFVAWSLPDPVSPLEDDE